MTNFNAAPDPFQSGQPYNVGQVDPFAHQGDPFAPQVDPFAPSAPAQYGNQDPFAVQPAPSYGNQDPFATGASYPQPGYGGNVDPFAPTAPAQYGNHDPFGVQPQPAYGNMFPAAPSAYGGNLMPTTEQPTRGSYMRGALEEARSRVSPFGDRVSEAYANLPPDVRTVTNAAGRGALEGVMGQYTKVNRHGEVVVKKTAVLRAAVNPVGAARRAVTGALGGAAQAAHHEFRQ